MLIILDRDGVINYESVDYIKSPEEWIPIPGSVEAIARLFQAQHKIVVATNQAGVGRRIYTLEAMHAIHAKMLAVVEQAGGSIEKIYYCPHHPDENCECRKPKPGMLLEIKRDYPEDFAGALFIGDSLRDIEAGCSAGIAVALVKTGNGSQVMSDASRLEKVKVYADLAEIAQHILAGSCASY